MKMTKVMILAGCIISGGLLTQAATWQGSVEGGAGYWAGETTYSIGGSAWSPETGTISIQDKISELTFPLDVAYGTVRGHLEYKGMLEFYGELRANLTDPSSKMKDSDFGVFSDAQPNRLDVYSESDADLTAVTADVGARYWIHGRSSASNKMAVALGVGPCLALQHYEWKISNVDQWYPSMPQLGHDTEPGQAATYTVDAAVAYLDVMAVLRYGKFTGALEAGIGPAAVSDEDDHMLRQKKASADMVGVGVKGAIEARYDFTRNLFARIRVSASAVDVSGVQVQKGYGGDLVGYYAEVDEDLTVTSTSADLTLGVAF